MLQAGFEESLELLLVLTVLLTALFVVEELVGLLLAVTEPIVSSSAILNFFLSGDCPLSAGLL